MIDNHKKTSFLAMLGALALMASTPAFAQNAATTPAASAAPAASDAGAAAPAPTADATAASDAGGDADAPPQMKNKGKMNAWTMFEDAGIVVKVVMIGLLLGSILTWTLAITKLLEFGSLNRTSDRFLEAFRGARSVPEMQRIATSEDFEGNPFADMAAAATSEVELSRQAGLQVNGAHRDTTIMRAQTAVSAVQASLSKRLSGGMQFLASLGSNGPFIGLFGTVYGIMTSFINIAQTNTTNLAVVAPGIAEALLATGLGLFAAIPSVIFYNYFQTRIAAYGVRSEGFVAELMNAISRQLDKGA
jgi:biopolymer transport protein ExbB